MTACEPEPASVVPNAAPSFSLSLPVDVQTQIAAATNVAAFETGLPSAPQPWEVSDSALVQHVRRANGIVYIALRTAGAARLSSTARSEPSKLFPGRLIPRGTRAGISATEIRAVIGQLEVLGVKPLQYFHFIAVLRAQIDADSAPQLSRLASVDYLEPEVQHITYDGSPMSTVGTGLPLLALQGGQQTPWGISMVRAPQAWQLSTGQGARVLFIDTDREANHQDLATLPIGNCEGAFGGCDETDPVSHGTPTLGVATALNNGLGVVGVAPAVAAADIFVWAACFGGQCHEGNIISGLQWARTNLGSRGVINLSLSTNVNSQPLHDAITQNWLAGQSMVASAGNDGTSQIRYPAGSDEVIGVSGVRQDTVFANPSGCPNTNSNRGPHVFVAAPFLAQTTTIPNTYATWCGNSFSAPHVTGAIALMLAAHPNWNNTKVISQLQNYSLDRGPVYYDNDYGFGLLQADLAVGLYPPDNITGTIVGSRPRISWSAVPLAVRYDIYRRMLHHGGSQGHMWAKCAETSSGIRTWTDFQAVVTSIYGYNTTGPSYPTMAYGYYVEAVTATGVRSKQGPWVDYLTTTAGTPC